MNDFALALLGRCSIGIILAYGVSKEQQLEKGRKPYSFHFWASVQWISFCACTLSCIRNCSYQTFFSALPSFCSALLRIIIYTWRVFKVFLKNVFKILRLSIYIYSYGEESASVMA